MINRAIVKMSETSRMNSIDVIKGLACIAVVFIHYNFPGNLGIAVKSFCRFGVPVFFFVSGFFLFYKVGGEWDTVKLVRKIRHILSIALGAGIFYSVFTIVLNNLTSPAWDMKQYMVNIMGASDVVKFMLTNDPFEYSHLWFLLALIYCYLFLLIFQPKSMKCILTLTLFGLIGISLLQELHCVTNITRSVAIPQSEQRLYIFNLFLFRALPFILIGIVCREKMTEIGNLPINKNVLLVVIVLGNCFSIFERFIFVESQFYIGTYVAVLSMIIWAIKQQSCNEKMLSYLGRELSLYIYIIHIAVGKTVGYIASTLHIQNENIYLYSRAFIILFVTIVFSLVINYVTKTSHLNKCLCTLKIQQ